MYIVHKEKIMVESEKIVFRQLTCDICKKNYTENGELDFYLNSFKENIDSYKYNETLIICKEVNHYPEDSAYGKEMVLDICYDCMKNKIIPLIEKTFDVKFEEKEF